MASVHHHAESVAVAAVTKYWLPVRTDRLPASEAMPKATLQEALEDFFGTECDPIWIIVLQVGGNGLPVRQWLAETWEDGVPDS